MARPAAYPGVEMSFTTLHVPKAVLDAARAKAKRDKSTLSNVLREVLIEGLGVRLPKPEAKS